MGFNSGATGPIFLGVAAVALLIFAGYRIISISQVRQRQQMKNEIGRAHV